MTKHIVFRNISTNMKFAIIPFFLSTMTVFADDVSAKKNPEYVRTCSAYGNGFFYMPGTNTCLRIGGRVRADFVYKKSDLKHYDEDNIGWRTRIQAAFDARTATDYGTLRTFIRLQATDSGGSPYGRHYSSGLYEELNRAIVQFNGFTAGRSVSFFDFSEGTHYGFVRYSDGLSLNLLAYTADLGRGNTLTLSLEDPAKRRSGGYSLAATYGTATGPWGTNAGWLTGGPHPSGYIGFPNNSTIPSIETSGSRIPEIVGVFRTDQSWGSIQLAGALHSIRGSDSGLLINRRTNLPASIDDSWGYAAGFNAKIKLDKLFQGDFVWLNATYTKGALGYMGFEVNGIGRSGGNSLRYPGGVSQGRLAEAIAYESSTGEFETKLADGWSIFAGLQHYWSPTIHSAFFSSYAQVSSIDVNDTSGADSFGYSVTPDFKELIAGARIAWSPVSRVEFGLEALYNHSEYEYSMWQKAANTQDIYMDNWTEKDKFWEFRLRVQRDF